VVAESQQLLEQAWKLLSEHVEPIRERIKSGAAEDRGEGMVLGQCQKCGGQLKVLRGKTGKTLRGLCGQGGRAGAAGRRLGGAQAPGCGQTFPLPQKGVIMVTGNNCPECGWPEIKVTGASGPRKAVGALYRPRLPHQREVPPAQSTTVMTRACPAPD